MLSRHKSNIYSQYGEDGVIAHIVTALGMDKRPRGWLIDFGAWDGVRYSNLQALVERGFPALEFEADQGRFAQLVEHAKKWPRIVPVHSIIDPRTIAFHLDHYLAPQSGPIALLNVDIDGDHAAILRALSIRPAIVVVEWCDHGNREQLEPLTLWARARRYKEVCRTNSNLIFVTEEAYTKLEAVEDLP